MRGRLLTFGLALSVFATDASATRPLGDYRYFRALSIDLQGRPPTRDEVAQFEEPGFELERWIDEKLAGPQYAERLRRIYADLLRLEVPPVVQFEPLATVLNQTTILDPSGTPITLYFRYAQRRAKPEIDAQVCFTEAEIGQKIPILGPAQGVAKRVSQKLLDERTVVVKPWWLYSDYARPNPQDRAGPHWEQTFPGYDLALRLFVEPGTGEPMTGIRVCREEAQTAATGRIYKTGRVIAKSDPFLPGRLTRLPMDTPYAAANPGKVVSCLSKTGFESSLECGCGVGLERCQPSGPNGFTMPIHFPLGTEQPFFAVPRPAAIWFTSWWSQEALHFLDRVFEEDRDMRTLLTDPGTVINGPLAHFYRFLAGQTCCGNGTELGYTDAEPLFDPKQIPSTILAQDANVWTRIENRGPHAAGIMTMPIFLLKYGSRRQRAHAIYNAFSCKEFVAENAKLEPSTEPNLMKRPGCSTCHTKLEPMSAYFARITESDWTFLPPAKFPISHARCASADAAKLGGACKTYYDPAFADASHSSLRGSYGSPQNADAGPSGLALEVTSSPEFGPCVVRNVAQSLLGRRLAPEDDSWKAQLASDFVADGYRMRGLVRAIVTSDRYRAGNDTRPQ